VKQSVIITGIKQIDRRLKTLPLRVQTKIVRQSIRKGLKILATEVKANVPIHTGITQKNVQVRAVKKRKRGQIELEVKIGGKDDRLYKTEADGTKVFYPAIVEYKHNPFMRRAFDAKAEMARQVTIQSLRDGVEIEARKP
jgi:HK97 gp10 family phage protein